MAPAEMASLDDQAFQAKGGVLDIACAVGCDANPLPSFPVAPSAPARLAAANSLPGPTLFVSSLRESAGGRRSQAGTNVR